MQMTANRKQTAWCIYLSGNACLAVNLYWILVALLASFSHCTSIWVVSKFCHRVQGAGQGGWANKQGGKDFPDSVSKRPINCNLLEAKKRLEQNISDQNKKQLSIRENETRKYISYQIVLFLSFPLFRVQVHCLDQKVPLQCPCESLLPISFIHPYKYFRTPRNKEFHDSNFPQKLQR